MFRSFVALSAISLGCSAFAGANIIGPGQTAAPDALTPGTGTYLAQSTGTLTATNPNSGNTQYTVSYDVGVYKDNSNVLCSGCLDFFYKFTNNGPGVNERFSAFDFSGFTTDVGYDTLTPGQKPISVDRSLDGSVVGFNYTGADTLLAGASTGYLLIETNAMQFVPGTFTVQDGVSVNGQAWAPATTPEPASLALFGTGLLGIVGVARRKFNV